MATPSKSRIYTLNKKAKKVGLSVLPALKRAEAEGWLAEVRHIQDLHALAEGCYFDARFASHAERFIEGALVMATGRWAGKPFALTDWQRRDVVRPLFGWRNDDGTRRFRSFLLYIPKKNGKTTLCAALMLYQLTAEPDPTNTSRTEQAAELYAASTSAETGAILYREADKLVKASPAIAGCRVFKNERRITWEASSSFFRVLPHKATSAEGFIASAVYLDEIHAMKSDKLANALRWAGASRTQPLFAEITTAGLDDAEAYWVGRVKYTRDVLSGEVVDTAHLGLLYEADKDAKIDDPKQHAKANPSLGVTLTARDLMREAQQAIRQGSKAVAAFKRYRLNLPVGASDAWIPPELFDKSTGDALPDLAGLKGLPCYMGLDLAKVNDFTALLALWPGQTDDAPWWAHAWFWLPHAAASEAEERGDRRYMDWAERGLITLTDGDTTDHHLVKDQVVALANRFNPSKIGVDRNFDGWSFTDDLFNEHGLPAVGIGQGWRSQDVPMQRIEELTRKRLLRFGPSPVMRWMFSNAIALRTGTNAAYQLDRRHRSQKVDGVAALINAVFCAEATDDKPPETYTDSPLIIG